MRLRSVVLHTVLSQEEEVEIWTMVGAWIQSRSDCEVAKVVVDAEAFDCWNTTAEVSCRKLKLRRGEN